LKRNHRRKEKKRKEKKKKKRDRSPDSLSAPRPGPFSPGIIVPVGKPGLNPLSH
jgi:hypothetical protein